MSGLFNDEFLRTAAQLRILARQVPPGGRHAEQRSQDRGSGLEFRDFRAYVPGDDLRRVDWNAYRRSGRLFLRLFDEPEDLAVHVLVDVSRSMFHEEPPRADPARQLAGLIAAVATGQSDRVTLWPFGDRLGPPRVVVGGQAELHAGLQYLEELTTAASTDFASALREFLSRPRRSGLLVIISDFFDARGTDAVLEALRSVRDRFVLVQVVRTGDADPPHEGEVALVDCETGSEVEVMVSAETRRRYQAGYRAFCDALLAFAARRRAAHVRLDADVPVLAQIERLFRQRVLEV